MTQVILADLLTGRRILDLPFDSLSWDRTQNAAETIRCKVKISARLVKRKDLWNTATPAKTLIAVIENDIPMAAAVVWRRTYNKADGTLEIAGAGIWSYFDHRQILPLLTPAQNVIDPATGESGAWANTSLTAMSYGTMAKRLIQQSMLWTGGNLPIAFAADEAGTYEKNYTGANLTGIGEALRQLLALEGGIDIDFLPRRTADRKGIEWVLRTGTLAQPELHGLGVHTWDYSVPKPSIRGLIAVDDASAMTGQAWTTGGRQASTALVERVIDNTLVNAGYPLLESVDSSHADVVESATLLKYSGQAIRLGRAPMNSWSFDVRADANPRVGSYWPGDFCDIRIANDPWLRADTYRREIASISGDQDGRWIKVVTQETIDG